uniref:Kelch-like protein 17 n=1 Tax=Rhizophagus irregularis (strain DAOM 181602 / DAOM 197198 / MUCL 43194) TaxID=747089 RepID=U9UJW5_RHIID
MNILNYRSPYLRKIISTNKKKSDGTLAHIKLQSILPEIFQIILRYIYGGRVSFEGHDEADVIKTLVAASELDLQELVNHLQSFLIEKHSTWMEQNFNMIYQTSFENDSLLELQNYCNDLISKNPDKIFNSLNFSSIPEKILISLIQNDNLKMNEVQVWKYVLKWGLDQNPGLPSDHKSFSGDDFSVLKNTLQQYISLIKFDNFSSKEFLDHSTSTSNIPNIEPQIFESTNITNINSKIITLEHARLISGWINRSNVNTSYEFKLIFRGSINGFAGKIFRKDCDNQARTVAIIKVKDSDEILGGYNPVEWNTDNKYVTTNDSFIFSFDKNQGIENHILSRVLDKNFAISNHDNRGPSFGDGDLILRGGLGLNNCLCKKASYEKPIRESCDKFSVEEYELFQIV